MKKNYILFILSSLLLLLVQQTIKAERTFIHPGGLHTENDFRRMAAKVKAQETPWIQSWNELINNGYAKRTDSEGGYTNIGGSGNRQSAGRDAYAAYLNILQWKIKIINATNDSERSTANKHADNAVRIIDTWSTKCTEASGELFQIPINGMVQAAELLHGYSGWENIDLKGTSPKSRFQTLCRNVFMPSCKNFWTHCSHESWTGPALGAVMIMSVFLEDEKSFDQAVAYFKGGSDWANIDKSDFTNHGNNIASVTNLFSETGRNGEMGRDQPHAALGPGNLAQLCKVAWNQGLDLFSFSDNRLLKGFDYFCKYNLNNPVEWETYHWCASGDYNWFYISPSGAFRTNNSPVYELIYNHYIVRASLKGETVPEAPYLIKLTHLSRPEEGEEGYFGFGTLTFTLDTQMSPYPGCPTPEAPTNLTAKIGLNSVHLSWVKDENARGYKVFRSTDQNSYTQIASWDKNTNTSYTDGNTTAGTTYYYKVCATNTSGISEFSNIAASTPTAITKILPIGWGFTDVGNVALAGNATHSPGSNSFSVSGGGTDVGGAADGHGYAFVKVTGDATIIARLSSVNWDGSEASRKAGLLMRETLGAGAKRALVGVGENVYRHSRFGYRTSTNGGTGWISGNDFTSIPVWFKLERSGNEFKGYQSADGKDWKLFATQTISMNETYYIGLFSSAATSSATAITAYFDDVSVTTVDENKPNLPTNFIGTAISSTNLKLSWTAAANAATYILKRSDSENGIFRTISAAIVGNTFEDPGLEPDTEYYYSLKSINLQGESTDSLVIKTKTKELSIPSKPTALKTVGYGNMYVQLQWNTSDEQTQYYNIKRSTLINGSFETIGISSKDSYVDLSVINGINYYYTISAVNILGESINSNRVSGKPTLGISYYWPLNEINGSFTDVWSEKTAVGNNISQTSNGKFDGAISLNGANSYLKMPENITSGLNNYTLSFWLNLNANTLWTRIFNFGTDNTNHMYITTKDDLGYLRYSIKYNNNSEQHINTETTLNIDRWYHVVVTQTGSTGILYLDGEEVGRSTTLNYNPASLGTTTNNYFGRPLSSDPYLNGKVDDIRIYDKVLNTDLIELLYNTKTQTIQFDAIPPKSISDEAFIPEVSVSTDLPLFFLSSDTNTAKVEDGKIHILNNGTVYITAYQPGNLSYAAIDAIQPLNIVNTNSIGEIKSDDLVIYPNPTSDILSINSKTPIISVNIYNATGRLVKTFNDIKENINLSSLPTGIYTLAIQASKETSIVKIIKK